VPLPVSSPGDGTKGRLFLSGGYNAGAMIMRIVERDGQFTAEVERRLGPREFGSTQHTPILHNGHLYGVREHDEQLVCLDLSGEVLWASGREHRFGLGPYLVAVPRTGEGESTAAAGKSESSTTGALIYVMDDEGRLTLAEARPDGYHQLAEADVLDGHDSWGPMAMVDGRLIVRDLTTMVCLDVKEKEEGD
jgi:outer membrane protein assembly factor BamB